MIKSEIPARRLLTATHGLRGLAALSVVLFHLHHLTGLALPPALGFIATHFGLGVQLFFVLSAFSLCYSTVDSIGREDWVRDYLIKRYFRIAPLFYTMLAAWLTLFTLRGVSFEASNLGLNVLMIYNFVPGKHESVVAAGWTIGVEILFYLFLPILLLTLRGLWQTVAFAGLALLIGTVVRIQLVAAGGVLQQYAPFSFVVSLGVFALGMVAFHVYRRGLELSDTARRRLLLGLATVVIGLFAALASHRLNPLAGLVWRPDIFIWAVLFTALIAWQALAPSRVLGAAPFEFAGERSFSIYLIHPMVIFGLTPVNKGLYAVLEPTVGAWAFIACAMLTLGAVLVISMVAYRLIEVPGMHLGRLLITRLRAADSGNAGG